MFEYQILDCVRITHRADSPELVQNSIVAGLGAGLLPTPRL